MMSSATQSAGRETILSATRALAELAEGLGEAFDQAVSTVLQTKGRVIVTGIGKSGHIARKIAATLASTGTPAFFIHATEASHGDLGMLCTGDTVLALSNSGNTNELSDALHYTRRWGLPLIGITSREDSMLANQSDIVLLLPAHDEACPNGLAPTTSTTLQLALGDALAVAIMKARGFSQDQYRNLHPGGALGAKLLQVGDLMHVDDRCPSVRSGTIMADAILEMSEKGFGIIAVTDAEGRLIGAVTDGDLRRHIQSADLLRRTVDQVMTASPKTIRPGALAAESLHVMNSHSITTLFVVDENGGLRGVIRLHDCVAAGVG